MNLRLLIKANKDSIEMSMEESNEVTVKAKRQSIFVKKEKIDSLMLGNGFIKKRKNFLKTIIFYFKSSNYRILFYLLSFF